MNCSVLIDGYNVIKRSPKWADLELERARKQLIFFLSNIKWPIPVKEIKLFFDCAKETGYASRGRFGQIQVCFAKPSADLWIQELIRQSPNPREFLLISDDKELIHTARVHGALCYSVSWLILRGKPKTKESETKSTFLSAQDYSRINRELSELWGIES
jgi:predicted RNA-binding protein with PIN domain